MEHIAKTYFKTHKHVFLGLKVIIQKYNMLRYKAINTSGLKRKH